MRRAPGAPRKRKQNIEEQHQIALIKWAALERLPDLPHIEPGSKVVDYLVAIPNGGGRSKAEAGRLKAQGVKAGVYDLIFALPMSGCPGLWVELKSPGFAGNDIVPPSPRGKVSDEQRAWGKRMGLAGYAHAVCWGWEPARDVILAYLRSGRTQ